MPAIPKCRCCEIPRSEQGRPMREMVILPTKTQNHKLVVFVCEVCDGPDLRLAKRKNKPTDLNLDVSTRPEDE